jgi:hypothetical protein
MPSSDRLETLNPRPSFSTESWDTNQSPVDSIVTGTQPIADDYAKVADEPSPLPPNTSGESGTALEHSSEAIDGDEQTLWEGQPSAKNFLVRSVVGGLLSMGWAALALATWTFGYSGLAFWAWSSGVVLLIFCVLTGAKLFRVMHSYHYRLTSRRLFVRTGLLRRRLDQIELLRVKDVYVTQSLISSWLGIGHVVVISSEQTLPRAVLYGIEQPRHVMDLIWLQTRGELDRKTSRVEHV